MNYLEFKDKMFRLACFSNDQVYAWKPNFDRNNLSRWTKKGLLIRLRQGYFTFREYKDKADYALYFANRIYRPSYISLHSALSFHGLIPESVVQITSVTPLKTASFQNLFGEYSYKSIKKELMFGYSLVSIEDGRSMQIADPEKAISDLLYLYPEYCTSQNMLDLRLDEEYLQTELKKERLQGYVSRFKNRALEKRVHQLFVAYDL